MIRVALAQAGLPPATGTGNPLWVDALLIGGILLVIASALMLLRNRKRQAGQALTGRDHLNHLRDTTRERDRQRKDLEAVALSIEEMARRVGAQLDNKASRVEALLDEAERTIRRLEAAQAGATRTADRAPAAFAARPADAAAEALAANVARLSAELPQPREPEAIEVLAAEKDPSGATKPDQGWTAGQASAGQASAPKAATAPPPSAEDLSSRVLSLAAEGRDAQAIAAEVNEHIGKVELILALARK